MAVIFLGLIGGYFAFDATHHVWLAYTCLAHALLLVHPVRALVLFCLAAIGTALVGLVGLVFPGRRDSPINPGPDVLRVTPSSAESSTVRAPVGHTWHGQASPFLDRQGRHLDGRP